jgi:hypothetical protein
MTTTYIATPVSIGQQYPSKVLGNSFELWPEGFVLMAHTPNPQKIEIKGFKDGNVVAGFKYKDGGLLLIVYFYLKGKKILSFDLPFDIRKVKQYKDHNVMNCNPDGKKDRYSVLMQMVDENNTLIGIRFITIDPESTKLFHSMLIQQAESNQNSDEQIDKWYKYSTDQLASTTQLKIWGV